MRILHIKFEHNGVFETKINSTSDKCCTDIMPMTSKLFIYEYMENILGFNKELMLKQTKLEKLEAKLKVQSDRIMELEVFICNEAIKELEGER